LSEDPSRDFLENEQITSSGICGVIYLEEMQDSRFFGRLKESRCFGSS